VYLHNTPVTQPVYIIFCTERDLLREYRTLTAHSNKYKVGKKWHILIYAS
jgi:hypothetical protein